MNQTIKWNIINSILAGALVLFGAFAGTNFNLTWEGVCAAIGAAGVVAITKFREFWMTTEPKDRPVTGAFNFI